MTVTGVVVIGLIGERSREVADFLDTKVAGEARARSVVVAVPANHSPVLRIRGALRTHAIAEAFRKGNLGVTDYYNLRNVQADTEMRSSIAGTSTTRL